MHNKQYFPADNVFGHHSSEAVTWHDRIPRNQRTNKASALHVSEHRRAAEENLSSGIITLQYESNFRQDHESAIVDSAFCFLDCVNETSSLDMNVADCQKIVLDYAKRLDDVKVVPRAIEFFRRLVSLPPSMLLKMLNLFYQSSLAFVKLGNHLAKEDFNWLLSYPIYDNERATSSELPILNDNGPRLEINTRTFLEWLIYRALQSHTDNLYTVTLLKFSCELKSEFYTEALEKLLSSQLHNLKLESLQALKVQTVLSILNRYSEIVKRSDTDFPSEEMFSVGSLVDSYLYWGACHSREFHLHILNLVKALPDQARRSSDLLYDAIDRFLDHHPEESNIGMELYEYVDPSKLSGVKASHMGRNQKTSKMVRYIAKLYGTHMRQRTLNDSVGLNERPSTTEATVKKTAEKEEKNLPQKIRLPDSKEQGGIPSENSAIDAIPSGKNKLREEMKMTPQGVNDFQKDFNMAKATIEELKKKQSMANDRISELENDLQALETAHAKLVEGYSSSYRVDGPAPAHLINALSDFRHVLATFTQRLLKFFEQKGVDPHKIVSQTLNHIVQQGRTGLKNVLISQVVSLVFENFENEQFQAGGETSIDAVSRCNDRFMESSGLKSDMVQEIYKKNRKFQAFCDEKWALLRMSFMNNGNDSFHDISSNMDGLLSEFQEVSLSAWKIHCLAFSFNPPASIIRVKENISVDGIHVKLIRPFDDEWTEKEKINAVSAFMTLPGFRIRNIVIPCQVYPHIPNSRKDNLQTDVSVSTL